MRSWLKLASVTGVALWASTAVAADHTDGPLAAGNSAADINDVYAFMSDADTVVLAMTVEPFAEPGTAFSDAVQYVFHVQAHPAFGEAAAKNTNIICTFDTETKCWVGDVDAPTVEGDASVEGGIASTAGDVRVYAGLRADPFYFYLQGFQAARAFVVANAAALTFNASGCPVVDGVTSSQIVGRLQGTIDTMGNPAAPPVNVNTFEDANVLALVVELDKSLLIDGTANTLSVWASTHTAP